MNDVTHKNYAASFGFNPRGFCVGRVHRLFVKHLISWKYVFDEIRDVEFNIGYLEQMIYLPR